jgi:hypothetical protein
VIIPMRPRVRGIGRLVLPLLLLLLATSGAAGRQPPGVVSGGITTYTVRPGDSVDTVAARFGVHVRTLRADNDLAEGALLRDGQLFQIDRRHVVPASMFDGIVVNIPHESPDAAIPAS